MLFGQNGNRRDATAQGFKDTTQSVANLAMRSQREIVNVPQYAQHESEFATLVKGWRWR
jgi:hypothetical protein